MNKQGLNGLFIINGFLKTEKFEQLYDMLIDSAIKNNINLVPFSNDKILPMISSDIISSEKYIKSNNESFLDDFDFCLFWDKDILLSRYIEKMGVPVINNSKAIELCDDKAKTHLELYLNDIPMPKTLFAPMTYSNIGYTNYSFLKIIKKELDFPIIIKERTGSFGMQVYRADNIEQLELITKEHCDNQLIYQQFIDTPEVSDIRINMIGDEYVAAMKRTAQKGDFRSNITNGGTMEVYTPSDNQIELCMKVMKVLNLDYAGIDILQNKSGDNFVCEVNSNAHFKNIYDCTGINCADKLMKYINKIVNRR